MANLGLTDSGLNRTQETALAVQKMNTDAAYNQRKQAAIKSLDDQINEIIATGNLKKQEATLNSSSALRSDLLNLENNYKANAQTYASDVVKADAEAEAARIKGQNEERQAYIKWGLDNGTLTYDDEGKIVETNKNINASGTTYKAPTEEMYKKAWAIAVADGGKTDANSKLEQFLSSYPSYDVVKVLNYVESMLANNGDLWSVEDNGGINWGWGQGSVDGNAKLKDENGLIYSGDDMVSLLKSAGMTDENARRYVRTLQENKGVTGRYLTK